MKSLIYCLSACLLTLPAASQITIATSDMPVAGQNFRVSNGLITPQIDPVPTGSAYLWDFSTLQPVAQQVDTFTDVAATGVIYSLVFANVAFNPNRANLATSGPAFPTIPQLTITDAQYFFYNSSAAYLGAGYGANLNGIDVPIPFNNRDRIYDFPVSFGNLDSSDSDFQISLPGLGTYGHQQHRVNEVDGYGTLITPYGTFDALRVKSVITAEDTVYLDTLGVGFSIPVPLTTEYKWLGTGQGIPLLQINTNQVTPGNEVVTSIVYRDSLRALGGIGSPGVPTTWNLQVQPNPAGQWISVLVDAPIPADAEIKIFGLDGRITSLAWKGRVTTGSNVIVLGESSGRLPNGMYLVEMTTASGTRLVSRMLTISEK